MRLLVTSLTYPPHLNGQSIFTRNLAEGLAARGLEVTALIASEPGYPGLAWSNEVRLVRLPALSLKPIHPDLRLPLVTKRAVQQLFTQFQPQIVHIQDPSPLSQAVIRQAHQQNIPVIITQHTGTAVTAPYLQIRNQTLSRLVDKAAWQMVVAHLNRAHLVTVPSRFSAVMLRNQGVQPEMKVIPCGIQLANFCPNPTLDRAARRQQHGLDPDKSLFLYVGRLDFEKNLDLLLAAMSHVTCPDIQLALAGRGAEEARLKQMAAKLGLQGRVHFLGQVEQTTLPELLNTADIFVMPGHTESFSIATLEAMACAKPILAVKAGALPELVTPGQNGCLFAPGQPERVAQAMESMAAGKEQWAAMGQASLLKARQYSLPHILSMYEQTYRDCLSSPSRKSWPGGQMAPFTVAPAQKLLVIAPHPDDELLAAGGLMQNVLASGGDVAVVLVSNGDGQFLSPLIVERRLTGGPAAYIRLGEQRQKETLAALKKVGVNGEMVFFLGYPDGRLHQLWLTHGINGRPVISAYTRTCQSPYPNSYSPATPYLGANLSQDLGRILQHFQPDLLVIPHPQDTHLDHSAVSRFARLALTDYLAAGTYSPPRLLSYLVHYQSYPQPRGDDLNQLLLPPDPLARPGWLSYCLSQQERQKKLAGLHAYKSQQKIIGRYLRSFARANEIFFELDPYSP